MPDNPKSLTSAEAEVMNVIWDRDHVAVPDIVDAVPRALAYTTIMTTVRILEEKGFVERCGKRGRAFLYKAIVPRHEIRGSMISELAQRLFGGNIKTMVLDLVNRDEISSDDIAEIKKILAELERKR